MKDTVVCCVIIAFASVVCRGDEKAKAVSLSGTYKGDHFSMVFEKGKCLCLDKNDKNRVETKYLIKKDKAYIAPIVPKGEKMTRNVWVVYTIKEKSLESSHVEDMDTGDVFYKEKKPRIILTKQ